MNGLFAEAPGRRYDLHTAVKSIPRPPAGKDAMSRLILFNKPFNVLCQFTDAGSRATLADYIDVPRVYAAGRLDYDSEGLVVLTDAGDLQHIIADTRHKLPKTYWAQVEGVPDEEALDALRRGVRLRDGPTRPAEVCLIEPPSVWPRVPPIRERKRIPTSWVALTLTEGRNRQVRRMTAAIGFPTLRLIRQSIGPWHLGDLAPGEWREAPLPRDRRELLRLLGAGGRSRSRV